MTTLWQVGTIIMLLPTNGFSMPTMTKHLMGKIFGETDSFGLMIFHVYSIHFQ